MLMSLGLFPFSLPTLAHDELSRRTAWRHATASRIGARDATQYVGPGPSAIRDCLALMEHRPERSLRLSEEE